MAILAGLASQWRVKIELSQTATLLDRRRPALVHRISVKKINVNYINIEVYKDLEGEGRAIS